MKLIKKFQIVFTILVIGTLILEFARYFNVNILNITQDYINIIICIVMLFIFASLVIILIYLIVQKTSVKKIFIFLIILFIEAVLIIAACTTIEDKIELRKFKNAGYTKTVAEVTNVIKKVKTDSRVNYRYDGTPYIDNDDKIIYVTTWYYDGYVLKEDESSQYEVGTKRDIYYCTRTPSWTRWSIDDSITTAYVCGILLILTRFTNMYITFIYNKNRLNEPNKSEELEELDDPIKESKK